MNTLAWMLRHLWSLLDGVRRVLHLTLLLVIFAVLVLAVRHGAPSVPAKTALVVQLEGRLTEQLSDTPFSVSVGLLQDQHEPETLVRDVVDAIHRAATDDRVRLIVLDTDGLTGGGLTKARAIGAAIREFRQSGKKVYAYGRYASQEQYYLMAQADEVYLEPAGAVAVTGLAAYGLYFHDALEKLGVEINVFKVGTHKSFTEPFTRQSMSAEDREQTLGYLQPLWAAYGAGVEEARGLAAGSVDRYVQESVTALQAAGGDDALVAEERHLVTGRKTRLQFEKLIADQVGIDADTHTYTSISDSDYLVAARPKSARKHHSDGQVAVLVASGTISDGERPSGEIGGDSFAALLRAVRFDDEVKAVVLRIDSGGGSLMASEVIRQEVAALKDSGKPVVASFSSVAASGGYYIAMDADEIWSEPTTITGSIGVFGMLPTFEKTLSKVGVASDGVATSPLAGAMHLERALTPEAKADLQLGVEHAYREFVGHVAKVRHKSYEDMEPLAEGRVYVGSEALKLGLVDQLGSLHDAIQSAARRAKLKEGRYSIDWRERELSWREQLLRTLKSQGEVLVRPAVRGRQPASSLGRLIGQVDREARVLADFNDPRRLYLYCGCTAP